MSQQSASVLQSLAQTAHGMLQHRLPLNGVSRLRCPCTHMWPKTMSLF